MNLFEKYRPRAWGDVVGQEKVIGQIQLLAKRGLAGRSYWISGQSGTGKTTIGRLIAAEVADDFCTEEIDATDLTPARLRDIERGMACRGFGDSDKTGRAYIVNEAHGLRKDTIRQLLVVLERIPAHVVFIFTTTNAGESQLFDDNIDAHPLLSRCHVLALSKSGLCEAFAKRAQTIARLEGMDGQPIEKYVRLMKDCRNNLRAALSTIETGGMLR